MSSPCDSVSSSTLKSVTKALVTDLRVDDETESQGLDIMSHGERGYNME